MRKKARAEFTRRGDELGPVRMNSSQLKPTKAIFKVAKISAKEISQRFQRMPLLMGGMCKILPKAVLDNPDIKRAVVEIFELGQLFACMASAVPGQDPLSFTTTAWNFMSLGLGTRFLTQLFSVGDYIEKVAKKADYSKFPKVGDIIRVKETSKGKWKLADVIAVHPARRVTVIFKGTTTITLTLHPLHR